MGCEIPEYYYQVSDSGACFDIFHILPSGAHFNCGVSNTEEGAKNMVAALERGDYSRAGRIW